jgi:hypothetical protein
MNNEAIVSNQSDLCNKRGVVLRRLAILLAALTIAWTDSNCGGASPLSTVDAAAESSTATGGNGSGGIDGEIRDAGMNTGGGGRASNGGGVGAAASGGDRGSGGVVSTGGSGSGGATGGTNGGRGGSAGGGGSGGAVADVCSTAPPSGCCSIPGDCGANEKCIGLKCFDPGATAGICKTRIGGGGLGSCWEDLDCPPIAVCSGAHVCPCGASCLLSDAPGMCVMRI